MKKRSVKPINSRGPHRTPPPYKILKTTHARLAENAFVIQRLLHFKVQYINTVIDLTMIRVSLNFFFYLHYHNFNLSWKEFSEILARKNCSDLEEYNTYHIHSSDQTWAQVDWMADRLSKLNLVYNDFAFQVVPT